MSNDFSYSDEAVEEDEVVEYINTLNDERSELKSRNSAELGAPLIYPWNWWTKRKVSQFTTPFLELNCFHRANTSISLAVTFLNRSSKKGNRYASHLLGFLHAKGELTGDSKKSLHYFEISGQQGNPRTYKIIRYNYQTGTGVKQNYKKAIEFFKKAADLGNYVFSKKILKL